MDSDIPNIPEVLFGLKGNYTLLIYVKTWKKIHVGSLGQRYFSEGFYTYTGSAFGKGASSLGGRIKRHVRKQKTRKWHIDYLLSDRSVYLKAVVAGSMKQRMECIINKRLKEVFHGKISVDGFGSSDCKQHCGSHLLYLEDNCKNTEKIVELYLSIARAEIFVLSF
ncbi:MAG: GIY-YIG nuclease family protein [Candidatus Jordarchaeaceae archaeon]